MDVCKVKARMRQMSISVEDVAQALQIDQSTYYRKIASEGDCFSLAQVKRFAELLQLSGWEAAEIFLGQYSHKCESCKEE